VDITQNYFRLFSLPEIYFIDKNQLSIQYRELQKQFHPDNYANKPANEQRLAMQFAAHINTAYQTLKSTVKRAEYLLSLKNEIIDHQTMTVNDGEFLMLQMEWRESLADIEQLEHINEAEEAIEMLENQVKTLASLLEKRFDESYTENSIEIASQIVSKLFFVKKMLQEIERLEASLFD
jgi:molecular chaperone HscB